METVPAQVLEGRNPWWREAWENLPASDQDAVKQAWRYGRRVSNDRLLPFIYGLMARERRLSRWMCLPWARAGALIGVNAYLPLHP